MAEKGRTWTDLETRYLLEFWSEEDIQRQLQGAIRNDAVFRRIVENLAKRGYQCTVPQCRAKIKSLKKKYKEIRDRMRRSGAGQESDDEVDTPSDFPYFKEIDVVMGGRAAVKPVHIFDSSSSSLVGDDTAITDRKW